MFSTSDCDASTVKALIEASLDDDKAEDIVSIDLNGKCSFADAMIVASGRSQRHVGALASKLQDKLKEAGMPALSVEGTETCDWVLIDAGDVIVHLFRPETREFYNIEKMWAIPAVVVPEEVYA
ncbi:MAG: ribosome silencing factor [Rickettsiales bacterium]|nr:ribosome silencing factor [Rickettsiales bacterium]